MGKRDYFVSGRDTEIEKLRKQMAYFRSEFPGHRLIGAERVIPPFLKENFPHHNLTHTVERFE
ncbi:hypothetical protein HY993_00820 [Candidatus Micrarchaeota archaeon]|nr:hypothetical protein [Candidatus Micrarchaeota archaeon]